MQSKSHFFDDISKLAGSAAGIAQGMRSETETFFRAQVEKFLKDMDLVTREEFEVVRDMAIKAREENVALKARLDAFGKTAQHSKEPQNIKEKAPEIDE